LSPALRSGLVAALLLALVGCSGRSDGLSGRIQLAVGVSGIDQLSYELIEERTDQVNQLVRDFEELHPRVKVNVTVFREQDVVNEVRRRNSTGLGPDLLFVTGTVAHNLVQRHQARSVRLPQAVSQQLDESSLATAKLPDGRLAGLPVLQEPQVACFDRRRLSSPPDTLQGLLESSETGTEIGLALDPVDIYWTAGPLGANQAFGAILDGQPITAAHRQQIRFWMTWLQSANELQRVNYFANEEQLVQGLIHQRLDWIPCHSTNMLRLRKKLGKRLGVSALPGDFGGPATPTTRQRVWAFGVNSSPNQRQISESFATFTVNPLIQRNLTLRTEQMLPVNRFVPPPVASSSVLQALVTAEQEGRLTERLSQSIPSGDPRRKELVRSLMRLVFGDITPDQATDQVIRAIRRPGQP
jgi:arabinogalactan oligomer/maltooligosaccharide transport system substrate-binding protein